MRTIICSTFLAVTVALTTVGCGQRKPFDGPTVDAFTGKVVHDGKAVNFPAGEKVELKLVHEKGESFGIPLQQDGSFKIGWMPIGKYTATLIREKSEPGKKSAPNMYNVPGGLAIKEGQADYTVELGKNWKP